ncbi:MAG: hypothetical protein D6690_05530 [Nitrospirae bacterium]|nr:MAG: hypothetical protein D6690_05530 [Nitrospirota bacterium]
MVIWCTFVLCSPLAAKPIVIQHSEQYFPDTPGNEWTYRGLLLESGAVMIKEKSFVNVSTVVGQRTKNGLELTVFHDTNPGDQGPTDSFYYRDAAGIRYYGSEPGTALERQLVPYQIVRFPLEIPSSFQQLDRENLDLGLDLDRDGQTERVDVSAVVSVLGIDTVTVPAGTYPDAVRLEAKMTMDVHLSERKQTIRGTDVMTAWFARGVGLLKYIERQTLPSIRSTGERTKIIQITEELEHATIQEQTASLAGRKSPAHRIFANHTLDHELFQIVFPSRLFANP